ncbi:MAG: tRNA glutamyl-Q(34) synthetase GluQRS [Glaciecola sp.]
MSSINIDVRNDAAYVGRFAPSPSGPLHFGSLVCALASYLHAKQHNGRWLVRIEDIDTPRVNSAMNDVILSSLHAHHLYSDEPVVYQSHRHTLYEKTLSQLRSMHRIYACECSRKQIKARSGYYDGHCRDKSLAFAEHAIRFLQQQPRTAFCDMHLGKQNITHPIATEDPVLKRRDGIYAYHLAVVADDIAQEVTHIVRGMDLLDTTPIHLNLTEALDAVHPKYLHIPVISQQVGEKLSKQHHAPPIDDNRALDNLKLALQYLGIHRAFNPNLSNDMQKITDIDTLLDWAITHWTHNLLPKQAEVLISVTNNVYSMHERYEQTTSMKKSN